MTTVVSVAQGGTGANSAASARTNLGAAPLAAYDAANNAYSAANTGNLLAGGVITGTLNVTQDIIVGGNVYLEGNTTFINVATYSVEDSLMYLASNNSLTDSVDIGFMGGKNTSGTYSHTGFARDATDGKYKLFDGLPEEGHVGNVVNFANTYLATLVANVEANTLTVVNGVSGNVNFDSGTLFVDSASDRIGIGTTLPTRKLHISSSGLNCAIRIDNTTSGRPALLLYDDSQNLSITNSSDTGYIAFINGTGAGTERVRIANTGNVGIGTTAPYSSLHLTGDLTMGSGSNARPALKITNWGYSASYRALLIGSSNTTYTTANTGAVTVCLNYDPSVNPNSSFSGDGREIIFRRGTRFVTPNSGDTAFNLTNLVLYDGSVGIGLDAPATTLHVDASGGGIVRVSRLGTGAGILQLEADGTDGTVTTTNTMKFVTNGSERMRLDTSGNLFLNAFSGRGGGSTGYLFKLNPGKVYFELMANNTTSQSDILFTDGAAGAYGIVGYDHSNDSLRIYTNSAERMRIFSDGNVAIGTTTAGEKLSVNGAIESLVDAGGGASEGGQIILRAPSGGNTRWNMDNFTNKFRIFREDDSNKANGAAYFHIINGGNVGIGTDNPSQKLHVVGNILANGCPVQVQYTSSGTRTTVDSTSFVEPSTSYRVAITPKSTSSMIRLRFFIPANAYGASNTIYTVRLFRIIGGSTSYSLTSAGGSNGSRNVIAGSTFRPPGYDNNDPMPMIIDAVDFPSTTSTCTYGFEFKRETGGAGTMYFGYTQGDNSNWGFDADIVIIAEEIGQ